MPLWASASLCIKHEGYLISSGGPEVRQHQTSRSVFPGQGCAHSSWEEDTGAARGLAKGSKQRAGFLQ